MSIEHSPARDGQNFNNDAEPFVGEREAASFLNISVRTLQRWRIEPPTGGEPLVFYKLGTKRVAYRLSDCSRFAENRSYYSTSEMDAA
ncbi:MAG: helix-turn-helix domain-containing protein [Rhodospirillales bacterium]|nr:helix-turn-helix domain-containing protein [Rhodospirillales bacterium]